jgi:hypothetical protein
VRESECELATCVVVGLTNKAGSQPLDEAVKRHTEKAKKACFVPILAPKSELGLKGVLLWCGEEEKLGFVRVQESKPFHRCDRPFSPLTTHSLTHSHTNYCACCFPHCLTSLLFVSFIHSLILSFTHTFTHTFTHS